MNKPFFKYILLFFTALNALGQSEKIIELPDQKEVEIDSLVQPKEVYRLAEEIWLDEVWNAVPSYNPLLLVDETDIESDTLTLNGISIEAVRERLKTMNQYTPFNIEYNSTIYRFIKSYLKYRGKYYPGVMTKAKYYFPMIEEKLSLYDLPLELKYLTVVESALRPHARSHAGATGLWQFMYGTGKVYGLRVSSYVDERRDPIKSTVAACQYLKKLYSQYKDWELALAAYNAGPGNVNKAIRRSGGKRDFWQIRRYLPGETSNYLPAFYAVMYIFNYAEKHGIDAHMLPPAQFFDTDTLQVKKTISFATIRKKTNLDEATIQFLNPEYKLKVIPHVKGKKFAVRLPSAAIASILKDEDSFYDGIPSKVQKSLPKYEELNDRIRYTVKRGEYLLIIARRFGVSVKSIQKWNGLKSTVIKKGQKLIIFPRKL